MRVPKRKSEELRKRSTGPILLTKKALKAMEEEIKELKAKLPKMIEQVEYTKSHGDFSENAAYQDAKATLRRTHNRIASLNAKIKSAILIEQKKNTSGKIEIGTTVVLKTAGKEHTFTILGSHESDPANGVISNTSPLGKLLLGKEKGDSVTLQLAQGKDVVYEINMVQ